MVVDSVQPLYAFLRFADQDKVPTLSEVLLRYTIVKHEYESLYKNDRDSLDKYMAIVDRRMNDLANGTYMNAAAALNPRTHYAYGTGPTLFEDLREAFERLTDVTTAAEALIEAETYRTKSLSFSGPLAARMACDGRTHPGTKIFTYLSEPHITILTFLSLISLYLLAAQWWSMFGSSTPTLSMLARCLVSQCASSSGCERNWNSPCTCSCPAPAVSSHTDLAYLQQHLAGVGGRRNLLPPPAIIRKEKLEA
ncbi:uncharacterized protein LOC133884089 [Phragmites australis]|uniref:uncharacterized protein LOC133884089 n=1 Tax=Phragmites australis TaxID=29695 RepID=UPI002D77E36A|nr:uncharacterized protein LOC133884089 [Phragmites australis]